MTGHDASGVYALKLPSAGDVLVWVATIQAPDIAGHWNAWDRSRGRDGSLYGISRESLQIVEMRTQLQDCAWDGPTVVGAIYGPGEFI